MPKCAASSINYAERQTGPDRPPSGRAAVSDAVRPARAAKPGLCDDRTTPRPLFLRATRVALCRLVGKSCEPLCGSLTVLPFEDIEIRITKSGEIFVRIEGADEQRVRDYRRFLEEVVGPIRGEIRIERPDWEKPAELAESEEEKRRREQELER